MENPKPLVVNKVPLEIFINALQNILEQGYYYVDIIGVAGEELDEIGIAVYEDYKELDPSDEEQVLGDDINDLI